MTYEDWAGKYPEAAAELRALILAPSIEHGDGSSETAVQVQVRLEASQAGIRLFRNNKGAGFLQNGAFIRWGLANDSQRVSDHIKSADLIGIRPFVIGPHHVGHLIGQFVSRECKRHGWKYNAADPDEAAQMRWAELIRAYGGDAAFASGTGTI